MSSLRRVRLAALLLCWAVLPAPSVHAQSIPFAFLIQDGWSKLYQSTFVRPDQAMVTMAARSQFHTIVNGQKGGVAGNALINAWSRTVADPYFSPLGTLAGVVTLDFPTFRGHLSVVSTPGGILTTIGIVNHQGIVDKTVSGAWVLADGTAVAGGTANDMVVAGLVHLGQPQPIGSVTIGVTKYFPLFPNAPIAMDPEPFLAQILSSAVSAGSFFGFAQGPLLTYRRVDTQWTGFRDDVSMLVMSIGGNNYAVLACTSLGEYPTDHYLQRCTVSGYGSQLAHLTGHMAVWSPWSNLVWTLYSAP